MQYQRLQFHSYVQQGEKIRILVDEIHGHHPAHAHDDFIEIAYIDGGRGVHILNGREERISEGMVLSAKRFRLLAKALSSRMLPGQE